MVEPVAPPEAPPAEPPAVPTSMVGDDGQFVDGWQKMLTDETLHEDKTLATIKSPESLAKSYVHVRKQVPLDKIAIPNENTSDEEWENWHNAGGRPSAAVDYNIARPGDFPEEYWNPELALAAQDLFHKIGLNSKQVAALMEFNNGNVMAAAKVQNDAIITHQQESKENLYKLWGAAYEPKMHQGNYAVEKGTGGNQEFKNELLNMKLEGGGRLGDSVIFSEFTSNIGGKFAEHGDIVESHVSTPGDIQEQITKIMADPKFSSKEKSVRKPLMDKVMRLREELRINTGG